MKRTDPIWSCGTCYVSFHITCIQRYPEFWFFLYLLNTIGIFRWAKDTIFQQKQQLEDDPDRTEKEKKICWSCPKCRSEFPATSIPKEYRCFCGRERDPAFKNDLFTKKTKARS